MGMTNLSYLKSHQVVCSKHFFFVTTNSDIDLREDEVLEEDRGEGEEVDDSPELRRDVRVIAVGDHETGLTELTKRRRAWEVLPLRRTRVIYQR